MVLSAQLGRNRRSEEGSAPPRSVLLISDGARDGGAVAPQPASAGTLKEIAELSGGEFFSATDAEGLERVYKDLASRLGTRKESREVGDYFAGGAAAFLIAGGALSALLFRRVP